MLNRMLIGVLGAAGAAMIGMPALAAADPAPPPPPPPPNVNALTPISPVDFTVLDGAWYAFGTPEGLTCMIDKGRVSYGCSGPIPGAPDGANIVSGGAGGAPSFASAPNSVFGVAGPVQPLPPGTRLSFRQISCGNDGTNMTCVNSYDQTGFVISPAGSFVLDAVPMVDRPDANPFIN